MLQLTDLKSSNDKYDNETAFQRIFYKLQIISTGS